MSLLTSALGGHRSRYRDSGSSVFHSRSPYQAAQYSYPSTAPAYQPAVNPNAPSSGGGVGGVGSTTQALASDGGGVGAGNAQTGQAVWDALNNIHPGVTDWVDTYKQKIIDDFPALQKWAKGGDVLGALIGDRWINQWQQMMLREAVDPTFGGLYSRTGSGEGLNDTAGLVTIPGLGVAMAGMPGTVDANDYQGGRYDEAGRFLGVIPYLKLLNNLRMHIY